MIQGWPITDGLTSGQKEQKRLDQAAQDSYECSLEQNTQKLSHDVLSKLSFVISLKTGLLCLVLAGLELLKYWD